MARFTFRKHRKNPPAISIQNSNDGTSPSISQTSVNSAPSEISSTPHPPRHGLFGLFRLNPNPTVPIDEQQLYQLDIVALHGIKGDAYTTWTHKNGNFWLRDQISQALPGSRIFSFGYDACVLFSSGTGEIEDFSKILLEGLTRERAEKQDQKRRIIFICHSMGGIVIKKALITAVSQSHLMNIYTSTSAIIFLATPHGGSDETKLPLSIANVANAALTFPSMILGRGQPVRENLIMPLVRGSPVLIDIQNEFKEKRLYEGINIASFQELDVVPHMKRLVVDKKSAILGVPHERIIPMQGRHHRNICRFEGWEDDSFKNVWGILREYADEANSIVPEELTPEDQVVLSSLNYPEMSYRRQDANRAYQHTCTWIFKHPSYLRWKECTQGLLWIKGKPGAGKSTLVAYIVDNFRIRDPRHISLNFFFHGRGSELQRTPAGMYRELLYQIYYQVSSMRKVLKKAFLEKKPTGYSGNECVWTEDELQDWLMNAISHLAKTRPMVIFIDALDETGDDNARTLIDYFRAMKERVAREEGNLRICISCRHYPNISISEGFDVIMENKNAEDIATYVHAELTTRVVVWEDDLVAIEGRREMEDAIVKQSKGVFQWVKVVVPDVAARLNEDPNLKNIHVMLSKVPADLGLVYENILANVIKAEYRSRTLLLMQWVTLSERPMSLPELRLALSSDESSLKARQSSAADSDDFVESDERMKVLVKSLSGGLVEVALYTSGVIRVQFIHQTVSDFFISGGLNFLFAANGKLKNGKSMSFSEKEVLGRSQHRLAKACMNYLKFPEIQQAGWEATHENFTDQLVGQVQKYQFIEYAITSCLRHMEEAERKGIREDVVHEFESSPLWLSNWLKLNRCFNGDGYNPVEGSSLLHIVAGANLIGATRYLIERGDDIEAEDRWGNTPVHLAALNGNAEILELLFQSNAKLISQNKDRFTPLDLAARRGHEDIVRLVLQHGADIDETSVAGSSLQTAARTGNQSMVRLLLKCGADINKRGGFNGDALQAAAVRGHIDMVKLLIDSGAIFHNDDDDLHSIYGNPLIAAANVASYEIIQLFLDMGISINTQGGRYQTALQVAADARGTETSVEFVEYLLEKGADVNIQGGHHGSSLQAAVASGNYPPGPRVMRIVRLLLANGADVNIGGGTKGGVLPAAAETGDIELVQILLDHGASINDGDGFPGNSLACAAYAGHRPVVELLLRAGGRVNCHREPKFYTPLQAAAAKGHLDIVKLLVEMGADINYHKYGGDTALHLAIRHETTVEYLLEHGADIHAQGRDGYTVLQTAAFYNSVEVVDILLDHGVDINQINEQQGTALHTAAGNYLSKEAFNHLLSKGANPHLLGGEFHTVLQAAAFSRQIETLETLLDLGVKDAEGGFWGNAYEAAKRSDRNGNDATKLLRAWGIGPTEQ